MTETPETSTSHKPTGLPTLRKKPLGCIAAILAGWVVWGFLILAGSSLLSGCASGSPDRWTALSVAGTGHTSVFQNGLPRAGPYRVVELGSGQAQFYRAGKYLGTGSIRSIEPGSGLVRIDVSPSARVIITGQ